jgi:hypothetical protein
MTAPASRRILLPALLVLAVALLYGRTLTFDFVNYDDYDLVARNTEFLSDPGNILTSFTTHAFTTHREEGVYYRPVLLLSYFADYFVWGLNPAGYHLTNILLHILATLSLFFLAREITGVSSGGDGRTDTTAFLAALIFAVHPVQTESVAWVAGRNDVLLGLFLLTSFLCYLLQYRESRWRPFMLPLSVFLFAAALLTKESAIFFAALFPLYELTVRRESPETLFAGAGHLRISVYLAVVLAYLGVRYSIFGAFIGAEALYGKIPFDNRLLMAPGLALTNMLFLVWPTALSIAHPIEKVPWFDWPLILVAVAAAAGMFAAWAAPFRRRPVLSWSVGWVIVGLVPIVNVFPLAVPILEHRLYVVAAGFALAVASAASWISRPPVPRNGGAAAVIVLCAILSLLTWSRLPVWKNSETLWLDAIAAEPEGSRAYFNLAGYYFELGENEKVIPLLEKYVALRPDDFKGYSRLRQTYFLTGRLREAAAVCRTLIDRNPGNVGRYLEAGVLFERLGVSDSVIAIYNEGLRYDPSFHQLHNRLGMWYGTIGDPVNSRLHLAAADSVARSLQAPAVR